jgi:hypothetical protein
MVSAGSLVADGSEAKTDTTAIVNDSLLAPRSKSAIDSKIDFKAIDSIFFDLKSNTVHLFEKAQVNYGDIELVSAKIEVRFDRDELTAFPKHDTLGREIDRPFFKDPKQTFEARELTYNLATGKARVKNIVTQEGEMFIHGDLVKKLPNDESFVQRARFTTCDLEHPHFHIVARRAKIIPSDKIVTGGVMLFLNDVPTPLALPFGLFPNTTKHTSGILVPTYGESHSQDQGFFLRDGGFYWSISDYMDWRVQGDIYSRGEWRVGNNVQYRKRYKFNGRFGVDIGMVPSGEKETPNFSRTRSFRVSWSHSQDPKANQNSTFSANVNFFNTASQKNSSNISDHFNNQSNSNVAYQLRGKRFQLATTANMDYNITTGNISATFPTANFSMQPIYPFQRKIRQGNARWYESFKINYSMNATNRANGNDSTFFAQFSETLKDMQNGVKHNIPMDINIKLLGGKINWNHSVHYNQQWNFKANYRGLDTVYFPIYDPDTEEFLYDSIRINRHALLHTEHGFFITQNYSYSTSFSTQLFGMLQFKRGLLRAFRHVLSPSIGFSISPDFFTHQNGYREYEDVNGEMRRYNIFDGSPAGFPSGGKSGSINFSLGNNFEMKIRDRKDTVRGERKVKLIDRLTLNTSYNLAADSLNWAPIGLTAQTTLFKKFSINFNAQFDLYTRARDTNGRLTNRRINKFVWETGDGFLLPTSQSMSTGLSYSFSSKKQDENSAVSGTGEIFERLATFGPQWSLNINYTIGYNNRFSPGYQNTNVWGHPTAQFWSDYDQRISQTLSFGGNLDLTEKWKISFQSGYDFTNKKISQTHFTINRDLHCWNMIFTWAPFGQFKEWSFGIRLNSTMLGDVMKYDRRRTHREFDDYF